MALIFEAAVRRRSCIVQARISPGLTHAAGGRAPDDLQTAPDDEKCQRSHA
jgi:hypothetical protein